MEYREKAVIESISVDTERCLLFWLHMIGGQEFGGIMLDNALAESMSDDLLDLFEIAKPRPKDLKKKLELLVGKECYVLRCFPGWNTSIEGLETEDGKRFTLTAWRRKHFENVKDPLETEENRLRNNIMSAQRRIEEAEESLRTVVGRYRSWE